MSKKLVASFNFRRTMPNNRCDFTTSTCVPSDSFDAFLCNKVLLNFRVKWDWDNGYYLKAVYRHVEVESREYTVKVYLDYKSILDEGFTGKHIGGEFNHETGNYNPLYIDGKLSLSRKFICYNKCWKHCVYKMEYWCSICYGALPTESIFYTDLKNSVLNIMQDDMYPKSSSGSPVINFYNLYVLDEYYSFVAKCLINNKFISKIIFTKLSVDVTIDAKICGNIQLDPDSCSSCSSSTDQKQIDQKQIDEIYMKINNNINEIARLQIEVANDIFNQTTKLKETIKTLEFERERECSNVERRYSTEENNLQNLINNVERKQNDKYDKHICSAFDEAILSWKTKLINLQKKKNIELDNIKRNYNQSIKYYSTQQPMSGFTDSINKLEIEQSNLYNDLDYLTNNHPLHTN